VGVVPFYWGSRGHFSFEDFFFFLNRVLAPFSPHSSFPPLSSFDTKPPPPVLSFSFRRHFPFYLFFFFSPPFFEAIHPGLVPVANHRPPLTPVWSSHFPFAFTPVVFSFSPSALLSCMDPLSHRLSPPTFLPVGHISPPNCGPFFSPPKASFFFFCFSWRGSPVSQQKYCSTQSILLFHMSPPFFLFCFAVFLNFLLLGLSFFSAISFPPSRGLMVDVPFPVFFF